MGGGIILLQLVMNPVDTDLMYFAASTMIVVDFAMMMGLLITYYTVAGAKDEMIEESNS
jgi:hypothetical protein